MDARKITSLILVVAMIYVSGATTSMSLENEQYQNHYVSNNLLLENLSFYKHVITSFFIDVCSVKSYDLDVDGDKDIVACISFALRVS